MTRPPRSRGTAIALAGAAGFIAFALLATPFGSATWVHSAGPAATATTLPWNPNQTLPNPNRVPIQHVVIVVQENHAYDDFYGSYCQALNKVCPVTANGIPPGTCVPKNMSNPTGACVRPFPFATAGSVTLDMSHSWTTSHTDYANGSMDGFYQTEKAGTQPFGYFDGQTIPYYWDMAQEYGLGDAFFSGSLSYSLPDHWDLVAADSPAAGEHYFMQSANHIPLNGIQLKYLNQANNTASLADLFANTSVSWSYYDDALASSYNAAINQHAAGGAFAFWNPLAAKAETYTARMSSHFSTRSTFLSAAQSGTLPNVSWVIPTMDYSDHPPHSVLLGQEWVSHVIDSVEKSPEWNSTAVFVTWDEFGGFWDHVAPPQFYSSGLGFRVPLLVISPYTPEGYVSHQLDYFQSLVHFVEWRFGVSSIGSLDGLSLVPIQYFDFNATPRNPLVLPNATKLIYPANPQNNGAPGVVGHLTATAGTGNVTLNWRTPKGGAPVTDYLIQYGPLSTPKANSVRVDGYNTSALLTGLPSKTMFSFTVTPYSANMAGTRANVSIAPMVPLPVPSGPNAVGLYMTLFPNIGIGSAKSEAAL